MWRVRHKGQDATQAFIESVTDEHQQAVKIAFLNPRLNLVSNFAEIDSCFCKDGDRNVTNFVSDGNIDVDVDRLIRRTAELTILNPTGQFTPRKSVEIDTDDDEDADPSLVGYVYLNRFVRIYRGVHLKNNEHLYAPVGTFMIDIAEIIAERNMTVVNLTLSDFGKRIAKSVFAQPKKFEKGTDYNTIIKELVESAGVREEMIKSFDNLLERPANERKISKILKFERGESRGEKLKELCDKWDIDIYFDPMGRLVTEDKRSDKPLNKNIEITFAANDRKPGEGMIVSLTRSLSDDNLFNHLIVVGTQNDKSTVVVQKRNTNPKSKTNIKRIGDRSKYIETERAGTEEEANRILERQWKRRLHLEENVSMTSICMPILEGNDIIGIRDTEFTKLSDVKKFGDKGKPYRLKRFNVPLVTSRQELEVVDTVTMDEL